MTSVSFSANDAPTESDDRVLTDEPRVSSAALCTTLNILDRSFRPEFTHQCVINECFRGHRPRGAIVEEATKGFQSDSSNDAKTEKTTVLHKSHSDHSQAKYELDVQIHLAPSCRQCSVTVNREAVDDKSNATEPPTKRLKFEAESTSPLTEAEIVDTIAKALPTISTTGVSDDFVKEPLGTILSEYPVSKNTDSPQEFVVSVVSGPDAAEYHEQVQKLSLWFIENADGVNVKDDQAGFWKVLYLYRKHVSPQSSKHQYSLAGYVTLFHFNAPFHKPTPGILIRICQMLVLPAYQRQGHGARLMQCVYDLAHGNYQGIYNSDQNIVQVNVEDPAPAFTALRHKMDLKLLMSHSEWWPATVNRNDHTKDDFFSTLSETDALCVGHLAKITPRQAQIVCELVKLRSMMLETSSHEETEKRFRLMVKKRLNQDHREELGACASKDEKKACLARLFDEQYQLYRSVLGATR